MADDDGDDVAQKPQRSTADTGAAVGPLYVMWENSLEKLKILNYENEYCGDNGRKPFSRIHFVFPAKNISTQFDEFIDISGWLCNQSTSNPELFKRDPYDDPNTVANKLMLALRQLDCRLSFPAQKLRTAHGEAVCSVLDFLTDKALSAKSFRWAQPLYADPDIVEMADDNVDASLDDIEDEVEGGVPGEDEVYNEDARLEMSEVSMDISARQIHTSQVDPIHWKTELERVGPKLKQKQQVSSNEWRSHVDMTVSSKGRIEKVLNETQGDLRSLNREISEDLEKMRNKERYLNNQFAALCHEYKEVKVKLEELENKSTGTNESVAKLTNELSEVSERLDELKESFESRDSGMNDTSPLVRIKAALQQIKAEVHEFDLRIGVMAHSVLAARVGSTNRRRQGAANSRRRRHKSKKGSGGGAHRDPSYMDSEGDMDEL